MTERSIVEIHTSDRGTFKRCRRKFGWGSTLRQNLIKRGPDHQAFFLGNGVHFAMEDFHGHKRFAHPALAFAAYYDAQKRDDLPDDSEALLELGTEMLIYYVEEWLVEHPERWETLVINGEPQVEVEVAIRLNELLMAKLDSGFSQDARRNGYLRELLLNTPVEYVSTYDRVVIDKHDRLYGFDYKTAAQFDELNLQTNPQSAAYNWSMDLFYSPHGYKPEGIIWQQHKKAAAREPKRVYVGTKKESFSFAEGQPTTYRLYKRAVKRHYGKVPEKYNEVLAFLAGQQNEDGDKFIRRQVLRLNQKQREAEQEKIVLEVLDMLDPHLPLYPNPTKDCSWDCPFKAPCLAMDDGSDYEFMLRTEYATWAGYKDDWRARIKYPAASKSPATTAP